MPISAEIGRFSALFGLNLACEILKPLKVVDAIFERWSFPMFTKNSKSFVRDLFRPKSAENGRNQLFCDQILCANFWSPWKSQEVGWCHVRNVLWCSVPQKQLNFPLRPIAAFFGSNLVCEILKPLKASESKLILRSIANVLPCAGKIVKFLLEQQCGQKIPKVLSVLTAVS